MITPTWWDILVRRLLALAFGYSPKEVGLDLNFIKAGNLLEEKV